MVSDQRWQLKVGRNFLREDVIRDVRILQCHLLKKSQKVNKPDLMKSKIVALSKNEDFKNLLKKKKFSNKYITLFFGPLVNKDNKKLNISFVAKKKLIRSAVKRNKVKRRLRNIINEAVKNISINFNYSYLVIAKITMLNNEYAIIKDTLFKDIEKIK
jgi:ribonuclease P protein component